MQKVGASLNMLSALVMALFGGGGEWLQYTALHGATPTGAKQGQSPAGQAQSAHAELSAIQRDFCSFTWKSEPPLCLSPQKSEKG